jgi:hypothetical protein
MARSLKVLLGILFALGIFRGGNYACVSRVSGGTGAKLSALAQTETQRLEIKRLRVDHEKLSASSKFLQKDNTKLMEEARLLRAPSITAAVAERALAEPGMARSDVAALADTAMAAPATGAKAGDVALAQLQSELTVARGDALAARAEADGALQQRWDLEDKLEEAKAQLATRNDYGYGYGDTDTAKVDFSKTIKAECDGDVQRLCGHVAAGSGRKHFCLLDRLPALLPACARAQFRGREKPLPPGFSSHGLAFNASTCAITKVGVRV